MQIANIMKRRVATVEMDDTLEMVRDLFKAAPFHHLLVVEEGELVGILSDKDLYRALSPYLDSQAENQRDRDTLQRRVHQVMTRQLITATPEMSVAEATALLLQHSVSCLPVLEQGQLCGIVTWRDLLRSCYDQGVSGVSRVGRKS
ncbi:MAG: CBS domain-containing protein [Aeromonadaceae bacterium]